MPWPTGFGWQNIPCQHCAAQPGEPCVGEYGDPLEMFPSHLSRALEAQ